MYRIEIHACIVRVTVRVGELGEVPWWIDSWIFPPESQDKISASFVFRPVELQTVIHHPYRPNYLASSLPFSNGKQSLKLGYVAARPPSTANTALRAPEG